MTFNNAVNGSNTDFELSSGTMQFANRDRLCGGYAENIGISYSAGTFTVQAGDGNALSATNPGYINLQSKATPGKQIKVPVTANQTFTDGSAGTTDNMRWNLTSGRNASVDIPFYLYAVLSDSEASIAFMISRVPHAFVSPASASIGKSGAVVNTGQGDFFSLANITTTDYDANPCLCIGSFRMQFTGATDSWTVQTLTNQDGIGNFQDNMTFSFPRGHFGAAASKVFADNGGTAPDDADGIYSYNIAKNGRVNFTFGFPNFDTAGAGAVTLLLALPFTSNVSGGTLSGYAIGGGVQNVLIGDVTSTQNTTTTLLFNNPSTAGSFTNAAVPLAANWAFFGVYQAQKT